MARPCEIQQHSEPGPVEDGKAMEILPRKKHQATSPTIQELVDIMADAFGWNVRGEECLRRMPTFLAAAREFGEIED